MRSIFLVWTKECRSYLLGPRFYVIAGSFLAVVGYMFSMSVVTLRQADLRPSLANMALILLFVSPLLTMGLMANEVAYGTDEVLYTKPVSAMQIVLGKYLAALTVFLLLVLCTVIHPILLEYLGEPDWGLIVAGYCGFLLLGAVSLAVGLFTSGLSGSQMIAGVLSFVLMLLLWVIDWAADFAGGVVGGAMRYLSLSNRYRDFWRGIVDSRNIAFYLSLVLVFILLTAEITESRTKGR